MSSVRLDTGFIGPCTVWKCFLRGEQFDLMLVSGISQQSQGPQECHHQNPLQVAIQRAPRNVLVGSPWVSTSSNQSEAQGASGIRPRSPLWPWTALWGLQAEATCSPCCSPLLQPGWRGLDTRSEPRRGSGWEASSQQALSLQGGEHRSP